jgi:hypothetical protein
MLKYFSLYYTMVIQFKSVNTNEKFGKHFENHRFCKI